METRTYNITPMGKPRMTQRDKWSRRPAILRYWEFKDQVRLAGVQLPDCSTVTFILPMPKSWSDKKRLAHYMEPHRQKPDVDNLAKALLDAVHDDDAAISDIHIKKVWGNTGQIVVRS